MRAKAFTGDLFAVPIQEFWTASVHSREKSVNGQAHLDKKRKAFGGQNKKVALSLLDGNELDDSIVREWSPPIWHLHSRISDLSSKKKLGLDISRKPHPTKDLTIYYMTSEQIKYNHQLITEFR